VTSVQTLTIQDHHTQNFALALAERRPDLNGTPRRLWRITRSRWRKFSSSTATAPQRPLDPQCSIPTAVYGRDLRSTVGSHAMPSRRGQLRDAARNGADAVVDEAIQWLDTVGQASFFLWTHLYDPHRPYEAPEPFASRYEPYVAEIDYADSQIARLLDALDARGLRDRVAVIVTGDHGESLGDHGEIDHGVFLYARVARAADRARSW
jgi:arylsulfatase A-like enzyme